MLRKIPQIGVTGLGALVVACGLAGPSAAAEPTWIDVPKSYQGVWSTDCESSQDLMVVSGFGLTSLFGPSSERRVQTLRFTGKIEADDDELRVNVPKSSKPAVLEKEDPDTLITANGTETKRCERPVNGVSEIHELWIDGVTDLDQMVRSCMKGTQPCRRTTMDLLDTKANGVRAAEIASGYRKLVLTSAVLHARMTENGYENADDLKEMLRKRFMPSAQLGKAVVTALDADGDQDLTAEELKNYPRIVMPDDLRKLTDILPSMSAF